MIKRAHARTGGARTAGLAASHQTGWTGTVARLIQVFGYIDGKSLLAAGSRPLTGVYFRERNPPTSSAPDRSRTERRASGV
jgi:hypothetical protein